MLGYSPKKIYTLEDYRTFEESAQYRSEYHNGAIISMTGGTINHNRIVRNLIRLLDGALKQTFSEVFASDLRLWIPQYRRGLYPDVMVISGEPILTENRTDEVLNPCLIVEVLSPSTSGYDHGDKFLYYRSLDSFQEYLLISQSEYFLEHYLKTEENQWLLKDYRERERQIYLESVRVTINIADIYEGVNFEISEKS